MHKAHCLHSLYDTFADESNVKVKKTGKIGKMTEQI